jgi:hypothetical protein
MGGEGVGIVVEEVEDVVSGYDGGGFTIGCILGLGRLGEGGVGGEDSVSVRKEEGGWWDNIAWWIAEVLGGGRVAWRRGRRDNKFRIGGYSNSLIRIQRREG